MHSADKLTWDAKIETSSILEVIVCVQRTEKNVSQRDLFKKFWVESEEEVGSFILGSEERKTSTSQEEGGGFFKIVVQSFLPRLLLRSLCFTSCPRVKLRESSCVAQIELFPVVRRPESA